MPNCFQAKQAMAVFSGGPSNGLQKLSAFLVDALAFRFTSSNHVPTSSSTNDSGNRGVDQVCLT